jgi:predicted metal-binding protein
VKHVCSQGDDTVSLMMISIKATCFATLLAWLAFTTSLERDGVVRLRQRPRALKMRIARIKGHKHGARLKST